MKVVVRFAMTNGGLPNLYEHALKGMSNMPPRGGCVRCTDEEVLAAVDYILDKSGSIKDLKRREAALRSPKAEVPIVDGKKIYEETCSVCHDKGKDNAPIIGDQAVWNKLIKKNMDILIINTLNGIGKMPAKGGCKTCSNAQVKAAVKYMIQQSIPNGDYSLW
jgi:cytochrome c5